MKADRDKVTRLLKTARGQIDGILRMIEDDRYCIDISNQLMAADAILRKANKEVLSSHMKCCVAEAMNCEDSHKKIEELVSLIDKL
ncbi:MAG: metal-sensing transcriptional repressor [Ruminococcus sp.]|nr:metal-sensing transcriptional repressor [Ruminococcus sp.]